MRAVAGGMASPFRPRQLPHAGGASHAAYRARCTTALALTPNAGSTHVSRVVTLGVPWSLRRLQPILLREFRAESGRTMLALKAHADGLP